MLVVRGKTTNILCASQEKHVVCEDKTFDHASPKYWVLFMAWEKGALRMRQLLKLAHI